MSVCVARPGRYHRSQEPHGCKLHWGVRQAAHDHGSWRASPCGVSRSSPNGALSAFGGCLHGASAALSASARVRPSHHGQATHSRRQRHTAGSIRPPHTAARAMFVPESGAVGSNYPISGPVRLRLRGIYPLFLATVGLVRFGVACCKQILRVHLQWHER